MRKIIILFLLSFAFVFPATSFAQYTDRLNDYISALGNFNASFAEFDLAKGQYMASKTLTSQSKLQVATYTMLSNRDEAIKTYLTALKTKLNEAAGVTDPEKKLFGTKLDTEINFFATHKNSLSSAATLEDQEKDSSVARDRFVADEIVLYQALIALPSGKITDFSSKLSNVLNQTKEKIIQVRLEGEKDTQLIERWVLEVENRIQRAQAKQTEAKALIAEIKVKQDDNKSNYDKAVFRLQEALQYLKEANSYLKEIMKEIKTK